MSQKAEVIWCFKTINYKSHSYKYDGQYVAPQLQQQNGCRWSPSIISGNLATVMESHTNTLIIQFTGISFCFCSWKCLVLCSSSSGEKNVYSPEQRGAHQERPPEGGLWERWERFTQMNRWFAVELVSFDPSSSPFVDRTPPSTPLREEVKMENGRSPMLGSGLSECEGTERTEGAPAAVGEQQSFRNSHLLKYFKYSCPLTVFFFILRFTGISDASR